MKKQRFTENQIMQILKQAEGGIPVADLCREYGMSNASFYKWRSKYGGMDAALLSEMKAMAEENKRLKRMYAESQMQNELLKEALGLWFMFPFLRNVKGFGWNHKRVYRIYREPELNLRIKPRRRLKREKPEPLAVPERPNDTWSMDFMADQLTNGRSFRTFNVLDDFSREGLGIEVWMYRFHQNALRGFWIGLSNGVANPERFVVITDRKISVPRFVAGQRSEVSSSITFNQENHNRMLI